MSIKKENVKYISLEGGGGAGNGYMGALKALYNLNILQYSETEFIQTNIKGFAGASAGAITSVLLACGFTPLELEKIMQLVDFEDFFDLGKVGEIPFKGGFSNKNLSPVLEPELAVYLKKAIITFAHPKFNIKSQAAAGKNILQIIHFLSDARFFDSLKSLVKPEAIISIVSLILNLQNIEKLSPKLKKKLVENSDLIASSIYNDWGIFLGKKPRLFIQSLINFAKRRVLDRKFSDKFHKIATQVLNDPIASKKYSDKNSFYNILAESTEKYLYYQGFSDLDDKFNDDTIKELKAIKPGTDPKGTTFKEFYDIFGIELTIMGTNLETTKSHAFSASTTPDFYVEDAVRLSMSLPMIYKPFIYKEKSSLNSSPIKTKSNDFLSGIWIDGGVLNNSPLNIFSNQSEAIGLRIEQGGEHRDIINDIKDYLLKWPIGLGILGSGESHISETLTQLKNYNTIIIDTRLDNGMEIGLLDFKPDKQLFDKVNKNTEDAVMKYFK